MILSRFWGMLGIANNSIFNVGRIGLGVLEVGKEEVGRKSKPGVSKNSRKRAKGGEGQEEQALQQTKFGGGRRVMSGGLWKRELKNPISRLLQPTRKKQRQRGAEKEGVK